MKRLGWMMVLAAAGLFGALASVNCGGVQQDCVPGAQVACECPSGDPGVQQCDSDGASYSECECDGSSGVGGWVPGGEDGPSDLPGDPAIQGTEVEPYVGPGGDCTGASTANVSVPWISQKISSIPSWSGNMCCGPAVITMAKGYAEGKQVTEDDLKATIDWMDINTSNWDKNGYKCDPGGTNSDEVVTVVRDYLGLDAKAVQTDWCSLLNFLDGNHVVIFHGDTQASNSSTVFKKGNSHWLILEKVEGGYAYVDDPGRTYSSQGDSHKFTVDSVRQRYEARGKLGIIIDRAPCQPSCNGKNCGDDGCGGTCGTCGSGFVCNASGQCVDSGPGCSNQCSTGDTRCKDPNTQQICADHDSDGCVEWGGDKYCSSGCSGKACVMQGCGNGIKEPGEACDGSDLGGATCQSQGYSSGALSCNAGCSFNTSACCGNECTSGTKQCTSTTTYQTCGNYDADACTEYGGNQSCMNGQSCSLGACACPSGNSGQFKVLDYVYPNFGPTGCSGDNTLKLKAAAEMFNPTTLRVHVRKADDSAFTTPSMLTLYVGNGPTCPNPPNAVKHTQSVVVGQVDQIIDLTVNPYGASWALNETKTFWVGKDEGGFQSWRGSGIVSVQRTCIP